MTSNLNLANSFRNMLQFGPSLGNRLVVGQQTLDLHAQVRILVPQPEAARESGFFISRLHIKVGSATRLAKI